MSALKSFVIVSSALLPSVLAGYYDSPISSSSISSIRGGAWPNSSAYPKPSGAYTYDDEEWECDEDGDDGEDDGSYSGPSKSWPAHPVSTYLTTTTEHVPCTAGQTITRDGQPWVATQATTITVTRTLTVTDGGSGGSWPTGGASGSSYGSGSGAGGSGSGSGSNGGSYGGASGAPGGRSGGWGPSASKPAGSAPSEPPSSGECAYYLEDLKHQGIAAFNSNPGSYVVFRDVTAFGAKGDGVTDDTEAINAAISIAAGNAI